MKGAVEALLRETRTQNVRFEACSDHPSYHPGRCAVVYSGEERLGIFGQIHPLTAQNYGVSAELYCAELQFDALFRRCV